ncbi:PQQ-binding-like beta-propeller repeat protein [Embleya sp. NPDC020886]|uniref:PQQ-binding-like beta-propeller repeat protein n=1 Tax=Embleya sp. NPDC020886 TaxID=3363980 RepID=UPI0037BD8941
MVADGVVYAGSLDGNVYALDAASGAKRFAPRTSVAVGRTVGHAAPRGRTRRACGRRLIPGRHRSPACAGSCRAGPAWPPA